MSQYYFVKVQRHFNHHTRRSSVNVDCIYIAMQLMDIDLKNVMEQRKLSSDYIQLFSYQILRGLKVSLGGRGLGLTPFFLFHF